MKQTIIDIENTVQVELRCSIEPENNLVFLSEQCVEPLKDYTSGLITALYAQDIHKIQQYAQALKTRCESIELSCEQANSILNELLSV